MGTHTERTNQYWQSAERKKNEGQEGERKKEAEDCREQRLTSSSSHSPQQEFVDLDDLLDGSGSWEEEGREGRGKEVGLSSMVSKSQALELERMKPSL